MDLDAPGNVSVCVRKGGRGDVSPADKRPSINDLQSEQWAPLAAPTSDAIQSTGMDEISTPDYEFEGFRLDTALQVLVSPSGQPIALPSRAFEPLRHLVGRAGELVERSSLMRAVWPRTVVEENNLSQCIVTLRRALGEEAGERRFILTIPGRGFKFVAPVRVVPRARSRAISAGSGPWVGYPVAKTPPPPEPTTHPPP